MEIRPQERQPEIGEAGFSIVEGLIAAALLLIVTVGVLPLFSRSMLNNLKGNDSTRQSNGVIDEMERSISMFFEDGSNSFQGAATEAVETRVIAVKQLSVPTGEPDKVLSTRWELPADLGPQDSVMSTRTRTLRQFHYSGFSPISGFTDPLPGDAQTQGLHFKVIDVNVQTSGVTYSVTSVQAY